MHLLKRARTSLSSLEDGDQNFGTGWPSSRQDEFNEDLCKLFVSCGFAWNAASNPEMGLFMSKWISGAKVPDRRVLSGRILDGEVAKVDAKTKERVVGKFATGQCDGWKNVSKTSIVTSMITVEHEVSPDQIYMVVTCTYRYTILLLKAYLVKTHDMSGRPKTGDELLTIVEADIQLIFDKFGVVVIAWCTDDGPDGKKMRRLLSAKYQWIITLVCWAHQINLVVGDFLTLKVDFRNVITLGLDVVKWFNAHSQALALFRTEQKLTYSGKFWALILPVITRWTAHYLSLTRLIKVETALRTCVMRHKPALLLCAGARDANTQAAATAVLHTVADEGFWEKIKQSVVPLLYI